MKRTKFGVNVYWTEVSDEKPLGSSLLQSGFAAGDWLSCIHTSTVAVHALKIRVAQSSKGRYSSERVECKELLQNERKKKATTWIFWNETNTRHRSRYPPIAVLFPVRPCLVPGLELVWEVWAWRHSAAELLPEASPRLKVLQQHYGTTKVLSATSSYRQYWAELTAVSGWALRDFELKFSIPAWQAIRETAISSW